MNEWVKKVQAIKSIFDAYGQTDILFQSNKKLCDRNNLSEALKNAINGKSDEQ